MSPIVKSSGAALYERVKDHIRGKVRSGEWKPGDQIPSENDLVKLLGISRMTVNRALGELARDSEIVRRGGVGTFVAEPRPRSTLLMIARIGDEIRERGHCYEWSVIQKGAERATPGIAQALGVAAASKVLRVECLHLEDGVPVQWEDRYVNAVCAPDFLKQSFRTQPPSEYLLQTIPAEEVEHTVDAVLAGDKARILKIGRNEPCLLLTRRTWAGGAAVTFARLLHPASRYRLGCRFKPNFVQQAER